MLDLPQHPETLSQGLVLIFALLIGHALGDYPLQGEFLAIHKNRHVSRGGSKTFPKHLWFHCLLSHSMIHAGLVWAITGRFIFALAEFLLHAVLDFIKCEKWTSFNVDQSLHALCKITYVTALLLGWVK